MELNTKKDFERLLMSVIEPLSGRYSKNCARLKLGSAGAWYPAETAEMEGFARPLWGLAPYWAGGGNETKLEKVYVKGIAAGCDPDNEEYWGECADCDQKFVEMAALAVGLIFAGNRLWEPLTEPAKDKLVSWLSSINKQDVPECNWQFFRILVNIALKKTGREYDAVKTEQSLKTVETFYKGGGWYSDGKYGQCDYYTAFAIHFYSLIYAYVMEDEDKKRSELFKKRAEEFAKDYICWFSDDGAAVPYGRSMTYRFAQSAFWSACVLAGVYPFPINVIKGIIVRNLKYWFENDDIFDNAHILTIGYKYNQPSMEENYNAPGSPYWCLKAFILMALEDDHKFWKAEARPMPELPAVKRLDVANMLAARYDGSVTLYPAGTMQDFNCGHMRYKYLKFAYSSLFGFSVPKSSWTCFENAPDSTLAFEIDERIITRIRNKGFEFLDTGLKIKWSPLHGIDVETEITITGKGHIRQHIINSEYECIAYDCGFAVAGKSEDACVCVKEDNYAEARNRFSMCRVRSDSGECLLLNTAPNTNLISPNTVIPAVKYKINKGKTVFKTEIEQIR